MSARTKQNLTIDRRDTVKMTAAQIAETMVDDVIKDLETGRISEDECVEQMMEIIEGGPRWRE